MLCTITGHRPDSFPFGYDETASACITLKTEIKKELVRLIESGIDSFITGMALGVDIWAAEIIIELKDIYPELKLYAAVPCPDQDKFWSSAQQKRYYSILQKCDRRFMLSSSYYKCCMLDRDRFMVKHSDIVLAVWNRKRTGGTAYTVDQARKLGKQVIIIDAPS